MNLENQKLHAEGQQKCLFGQRTGQLRIVKNAYVDSGQDTQMIGARDADIKMVKRIVEIAEGASPTKKR